MKVIKAVIQRFVEIMDRISGILFKIAAAIALISVLLIIEEALNRIIVFSKFSIAEEYTGYTLFLIIALAAPEVLKRGQFIRLYLFSSRLPQRVQDAIMATSYLVGLFVVGVYLSQVVRMLQDSLSYSTISLTVVKTPLWIPQLIMVVGLAIALLQILRLTVRFAYATFRPQQSQEKEAKT